MAQTGYTPIILYHSTTAAAAPTAGNLNSGELALNIQDEKLYFKNAGGTVKLLASSAGAAGDVVGPASATDNAIVRFDGTTGKLVQNSVVTIADTTGDISGVGQLNATTLDATNLEVTNIKAKDGTAAIVITDSTGAVTVNSAFSTTGNTTLGNASGDTVTVTGTITSNLIFTDNTYDIGASGATRPRNLFLAGDATIGGSIAATTLDLTNLEVTNIKAKDGTASATIADSTGVMTIGSSVLTTTDINGGTIDGAVIGGSTPAAGNFTTLSVDGLNIDSNAGNYGIKLDDRSDFPALSAQLGFGSSLGDCVVFNNNGNLSLNVGANFGTDTGTQVAQFSSAGLAVTGQGSLAGPAFGTFIAANLATGRLLSGTGTTVNAINTYYDTTAYEISAGSTTAYVSGITVAARSYAGTGGEGVAVWQRGAEVARFTSTGLAVTGALSATTSVQGGPGGGGGLILQTYTGGTFGAVYSTSVTPGATNYSLISTGANTYLNGTTSSNLTVGNTLIAAATATGLAVTGDISASQQLLWGTGSLGRISHDGTNAYFDNVGTGAIFFRTNGTTLLGTWQASGLAVTGAISSTTEVSAVEFQLTGIGSFSQGSLYLNATHGLIVGGKAGSTNDVYITNSGGTAAITVPTGTTNVGIGGNLTVTGGTITTGSTTALSLATSGGTQVIIENIASANRSLVFSGGNGGNNAIGTTAGGIDFSLGGSPAFRLNAVASSVNYLSVFPSASGGTAVALRAEGSDTNINMFYDSQGGGGHYFRTGGLVNQVVINHTASAVNYINVSGSATGGSPYVIANGSDANISLNISSKGSGNINLFTNAISQVQVQVQHTASANRYITLTGSNGGNPTIGTSAGDLAISTNLNVNAQITATGLVVTGGSITTGNTTPLALNTGGGTVLDLRYTANSVNYLQILPSAATGEFVILRASGTDTNVSLYYDSQGTGSHNFRTGNGGGNGIQVSVLNTASANRYITLTGSNGGNPTIGTNAGDLALGSRLKAASGAWTESGNLSTTSGVASTIFTMSGANRGRYEIVAMIANSGAPAQYTAVATAIWDGSGARIVSSDGANLTLTLSGGAVQVTQTAGSTQTVYWSHLYIPLE